VSIETAKSIYLEKVADRVKCFTARPTTFVAAINIEARRAVTAYVKDTK